MQYVKLGTSELNVSRICMGCMGFGDAARGQHTWTLDEEHWNWASIFLTRPLAIKAEQASSILGGR